MDHQFCPGSKALRQPAPEIFSCPSCGEDVEIWTDEFKANCPKCGRSVLRDATMGCLDWCKYAKECVGDAVYDRYMRNRVVGMKKKLLEGLEGFYSGDTRKIDYAQKVLKYAERLLEDEEADWHIVIPASLLHSVQGPDSREQEGLSAVRDMLMRLGFMLPDIEQVCDIIARLQHPLEDGSQHEEETQNFKVAFDAYHLAKIRESEPKEPDEKGDRLEALTDKSFYTVSGKKLASRELSGGLAK